MFVFMHLVTALVEDEWLLENLEADTSQKAKMLTLNLLERCDW